MSVIGGPGINENGLVLYLDAANTKSYISASSTWSDLSGNNNHVTLINSPTFNNRSAGCLSFTGTQYGTITSPQQFNYDINLSISVWCLPTSTLTGNTDIRETLFSGDTTDSIGIEIGNYTVGCVATAAGSDGRRFMIHRQGNCYANMSNTFQFNQNQLVNFTYTRNSSRNGILYINSIPILSLNDETSWQFSTPNTLYIGNRGTSLSQPFNGDLHQIQVYNRTLSAQEINQNFNAQRSRFGV